MPIEKSHGQVSSVPTEELLIELARRVHLQFGRIEAVFHDGKPSPRILVEHRIQREIDHA